VCNRERSVFLYDNCNRKAVGGNWDDGKGEPKPIPEGKQGETAKLRGGASTEVSEREEGSMSGVGQDPRGGEDRLSKRHFGFEAKQVVGREGVSVRLTLY